MLKAGRITEEEAARARAAAARGGDDVIEEIRLGHVKATLDAAVEAGDLSRQQAEALLERVKRGERPRLPRGALRHGGADGDSGHRE